MSKPPAKLSKIKTEKGLIVFGNVGILVDLEQFQWILRTESLNSIILRE